MTQCGLCRFWVNLLLWTEISRRPSVSDRVTSQIEVLETRSEPVNSAATDIMQKPVLPENLAQVIDRSRLRTIETAGPIPRASADDLAS
jgi:hypothetical protein